MSPTSMLLGATLLAAAAPETAAGEPWQAMHERLCAARTALSARLAQVLEALRERIKKERPELLPRLDPPPKPLATGYGLLPEIGPDAPERDAAEPTEKRFTLVGLGDWIAREHGRAGELGARVEYRLGRLDELVESYNARAREFRSLDSNVNYHGFWQGEIRKWPGFWRQHNAQLALYRTWRAPAADDAARARAEEARRNLEGLALAFRPSSALCATRTRSGGFEIRLPIATDIEDAPFLDVVTDGVERTWNQSVAMQEARLRIGIDWDVRPPASLYPEGAPARGTPIDLAAHRKRFGEAPFVLTTGARSTHALAGAVFLSPDRTTAHNLAHEIAHLLGFDDSYLRAYEGSPDDEAGVIIVEVTPFPATLMADPGSGKVTAAMVEKLVDAYAARTHPAPLRTGGAAADRGGSVPPR